MRKTSNKANEALILKRFQEGLSIPLIAARLGLRYGVVHRILRRRLPAEGSKVLQQGNAIPPSGMN